MSAAAAVRHALVAREPDISTQVVDSYKYAASMVSRVVSDGYIGMVKTIPQMYRYIYNRAERATEVGPFRTWIHQFSATNIRPLMERTKPDVVVCTHAFPSGVMAEYKRQFTDAPPVIGVVTDFAVHAFWVHDNIDCYAVASEETCAALLQRGVAAERVIVSGIPVGEQFARPTSHREELKAALGLPGDRPVVLLMGGGLGIGPLQMMLRALRRVDVPFSAVVIAGKSKRQHQRVSEAAQLVEFPVRVLSFVENVYDYMHCSDLLISKPGGLTVSEALVSGLPMVLVKPLPGQEERNTRYLVDRGAAIRARRERDLTEIVNELLAANEKLSGMRAAGLALAKPNAAGDVADAILRLARVRKGPPGDSPVIRAVPAEGWVSG